jgi:endonuclease V-like protein UPF0215 family
MVMVDGRIVKCGGRLVAYDIDKIVRDAKESPLRIALLPGVAPAPPLTLIITNHLAPTTAMP